MLVYSISPALYAADELNDDQPSLAFLEFLGSFETEDGQWIDPMEIEEMLNIPTQKTTEEADDE
ncbi:MAG TPA: hypothetical protein ENK06_09030 [Gammaproteobacteria bacterium]|nr:hypothetical protein [Gammaproteobacteria bacterium]